jgi:glycosidase
MNFSINHQLSLNSNRSFAASWLSPMQRRLPTICLPALVGAALFFAQVYIAPSTAFARANSAAPTPATSSADFQIAHIEPSSWWVGMQSPELQLMVHGKNIAQLTPQISYAGVTLNGAQSLDNPNYIFLNLHIAANAQPGQIEIRWMKDGQQVLVSNYTLAVRRKDSAQRASFTPADAIYLVVPDRFANGDTRNDNHTGLVEKANRQDPGGRHGGDIAGLRQHLNYIAKLGFTMLWPTPMIENNQAINSYHGYSATDFYQVDARLGSNQDYRAMVQEAKSQGIGVIHDVVLNHIGSMHWWMKDMPSKDWLNYPTHYTETNHTRSTVQDIHGAQYDRQKFADGWFTHTMPDLNQRNPFLANYLIQNTLWWIEYADLAGIRTDTYSYSDKAFLARWSRRITEEYPNINLVGEEWSMNPAIVAYWQKDKLNQDGYQSYMPSMMDFSVYETMHTALIDSATEPADINKLYAAIANDFQYAHPDNLTIFEGNHDTPRLFSALKQDYDLYKMAMVYLATTRGIPQMFYGTELLMTSPEKRDDGKVRGDFPGGWTGDKVDAFQGTNLSAAQSEAQKFVTQLFNWRKGQTAIHQGKLIHFIPENNCYVYFRVLENKIVMVVLNRNPQAQDLDLARFQEVLNHHHNAKNVFDEKRIPLDKTLKVQGKSASIFEIE